MAILLDAPSNSIPSNSLTARATALPPGVQMFFVFCQGVGIVFAACISTSATIGARKCGKHFRRSLVQFDFHELGCDGKDPSGEEADDGDDTDRY